METINCIICNNDKFVDYISFQKSNSDDIFKLVKCECNFIYLNPRPDSNEISKYYNREYIPHLIESKSYFDSLYTFVQKFTFKWKLKIIKKNSRKSKSVLDIGGGSGAFCEFLKNKGKNAFNYDPYFSESDTSSINDLNKKYDVITLWHSLEHMHNVNQVFEIINKHLEKKGMLYIAVPNFLAYERKYMKYNWPAYDIPRHLYHFTPDSIKRLLKKQNFEVVKYYTMIQDTFFNVLVSKNNNFLKKIYILLKSLTVIFLKKEKSSSILYVCKRI